MIKIQLATFTTFIPAMVAKADVITITTAYGNGADAQVTENNDVSGGDGTGAAINASGYSGADNDWYVWLWSGMCACYAP